MTDLPVVAPVHRVVLEQVRQGGGIGEIVDGNEVEVSDALLLGGAKHLAADAAEAVDAYANSHSCQFRMKS